MKTYCTNLRTEEMTEYGNFDFLAYGRLGGQVYGLKADGVYAFGGSTDAGVIIDASFKTVYSDNGNDESEMEFKRARMAYVEAAYQPVAVTPHGDNAHLGTFYGNSRVKLPRGEIARQWSFEIANVGGEDAKITSFEILFERSGRKA